MKYTVIRLAIALFLSVLFMNREASASCTLMPAGDIHFTLPATLTVNRDAPIGAILLSVPVAGNRPTVQ